MNKEKIRRFVGMLGSTHYVPVPVELRWNRRDVVEIEIVDEKTYIVRKLI